MSRPRPKIKLELCGMCGEPKPFATSKNLFKIEHEECFCEDDILNRLRDLALYDPPLQRWIYPLEGVTFRYTGLLFTDLV